jgi:hypothetical protein
VHLPLELDLHRRDDGTPIARWRLQGRLRQFSAAAAPPPPGPAGEALPPLRPAGPGGCTVDLRL